MADLPVHSARPGALAVALHAVRDALGTSALAAVARMAPAAGHALADERLLVAH